MSKTHGMFIAVVIVLCGCVQVTAQVPAVTSSPNDRELLLIERIEKLERHLAELEAKLNTNSSSSIETTPPAEIKTTPLWNEVTHPQKQRIQRHCSADLGLPFS